MKKLFYITSGLLLFSSCGQEAVETNNQNVKTELSQTAKEIVDDRYKLLTETPNVNANSGINKCNIDIELKKKLSKTELTSIANKLRETRKSYDKLWIFYYLSGMKVGSGAWATSHFTPNLQVDILGSTIEEDAKQKSQADKIDGKIIGKFYEQQYTSASYVVYEKANKTFLKTIHKNAQTSIEEMKKKNVSNGMRLNYKSGSYNGEYFILTKSNVLEFYNSENKKFTTAKKTD